MKVEINTTTVDGKTVSKVKINGKKYTINGRVYLRGNEIIDERGKVIDDNYLFMTDVKNKLDDWVQDTTNDIYKDYVHPTIIDEVVEKEEKEISEYKPVDIKIDPLTPLKNKRTSCILLIVWLTCLSIGLTLLSAYYFSKGDTVWGVVEIILASLNYFLLGCEIKDLMKLAKEIKEVKTYLEEYKKLEEEDCGETLQ